MDSRVTTWEDNAAEFRQLDGGEGWPFAVLVACSTFRGRESDKINVAAAKLTKVSVARFAEFVGVDFRRVSRYLDAWEAAARDGLVPPSARLTPGDAHTFALPTLTPEAWEKYSRGGSDLGRKDDNERQRLTEIAEAEGTKPGTLARVMASPKAVAAAIKADPGIADRAQEALTQTGRPPAPAAVAKALEDPAYARSVVRRDPHGPGIRNVEREVAATVGISHGGGQGSGGQPPPRIDTGAWFAVSAILDRARHLRAELRQPWAELNDEQREIAHRDLAGIVAGLTSEFLSSPIPDDASSLDPTP